MLYSNVQLVVLVASLFHSEVAPQDPSYKAKKSTSRLQLEKQYSVYRNHLMLVLITFVKVLLGLQLHLTHTPSFGIMLQCRAVAL